MNEEVKEFIKQLKFRDLRINFTSEEWAKHRMSIIRYEELLDKKIKKLAGPKLI